MKRTNTLPTPHQTGKGGCPRCGTPMLNLGWLDIDRYDDACPKCDRETFLRLGYDPEGEP